MKIDVVQISKLASNAITFGRGLDYYQNRAVTDFGIDEQEDDGAIITEITAKVEGDHNCYNVLIELEEDGTVLDFKCNCQAFHKFQGTCKHIVATMLHAFYHGEVVRQQIEPVLSSISNVKTDNYATMLISKYSNKIFHQTMAQVITKKATLYPVLELDYRNNLLLTLKIGYDRPYVIKDMTKFYLDMKQHNTVEYGKQLKFVHAIENFEPDSKVILDFCMKKYEEFNLYNSKTYSNAYGYDKRGLLISPNALDQLFELYLGKSLNVSIKNSSQIAIQLIEENPVIELNLQKTVQGHYTLFIETLHSFLFKGESNLYIIKDTSLYKCDAAFSEAMEDLLTLVYQKGSELVINPKDIPALQTNVLDEVRSYVTLNIDESIKEFEPEPLTCKLYLDIPSPNVITCKLLFCYPTDQKNAFSNKKITVRQNIKKELQAKAILQKYIPNVDDVQQFTYITQEQQIYTLLTDGLPALSKECQIYASENFKKIEVKRPPAVSVGVKLKSELLDVTLQSDDVSMDELADILDSYRQKKNYHRLRSGSFLNLADNALSELSDLTESLDFSSKDISRGHLTVPKYRALYLDTVINQSEQLDTSHTIDFKKIVHNIKDVDYSDFKVPNNLNGTLRNYQEYGFRWLKTMGTYGFGAILADDMGLGKTFQVIALLQSYQNETTQPLPSIVVCPSSLALNWESELQKFAPSLSFVTVIGTAPERERMIETCNNYNVVITSYDLLKRDVDLYEDKQFMFHIIDEAQYIKNHNTQNAKAVKRLNSVHHFALTGTPIENSLSELWSIFDFLMPKYLYHYNRFKTTLESPIVKSNDKKATEKLKRLVAPFILRRLKKDVLKELPDKTETVMYCSLEGEQKALYTANVVKIKQQLDKEINQNGFDKSKILILSMLTRLRQLCCDPSLYYDNYNKENAKLELCIELVENCISSGRKILLFSQFTSMLTIIEARLKKKKISCFMLRGSTKKEDRLDLVNRFNADDTNVFLISLKAGGTGLNLTGADVVIHYDPWWNLSAQNQATGRAHRIGQKNSVDVYKLIMKDSIEEKIIKLQDGKQELADSVISEGDGIITKMKKDDIMALFE